MKRQTSEAAHLVLDDKYDNLLISKAFGDIGIEFFYLPDIIREFGQHLEDDDKFGLLQRSMEYLVPAGDKIKLNNLEGITGDPRHQNLLPPHPFKIQH